MKTIVTFSGNKVRVLCGNGDKNKITVDKIIDVDFRMNCVMNGVITDKSVFIEGIKSTWEKNRLPIKQIILIVDGNHIRTKKLVVPKVAPNNMKKIIKNDFIDGSNDIDSLVSGYVELSNTKNEMTVMGIAGEKSYITEVSDAFSEAGIKLSCITTSKCAIIKSIEYIGDITGKNCIVQILNGELMSSILIENGGYVNISSVRIFSEHGTNDFGAEVSRSVSQLLQFQISQRSENAVTDVLCLGFSDEDFAVSSSQISALNLTSKVINPTSSFRVVDGRIADCFEFAGAFVLPEKSGNLYSELHYGSDSLKERDKKILMALPALIVVAALSITSSFMISFNNKKEAKKEMLSEYVSDEGNKEKYSLYNDYLQKAAQTNSRLTISEEIKDAIESYPYAVSTLGNTIASCGTGIVNVTITSYDSDTGVLGFTATGKRASNFNEFIKALSDTGIFYNVTYFGYSIKTNEDVYNVNVTCVLSEEAGK